MSCIALSKPYTPEKLVYPVHVTMKLDGVPVRIDINEHGNFNVRSRQGKPVPSVWKLVQDFVDQYVQWYDAVYPVTFVGEVFQRGNSFAPFKDTSGIVRRQDDQSDKLAIALFDVVWPEESTAVWEYRGEFLWTMYCGFKYKHVRPMNPQIFLNQSDLEGWAEGFFKAFPKAEGLVIRGHDDVFREGKRSWGYQKMVRDPTIDLWIVGVEEAVDQYGNPKGMAGRLIAMYKGDKIGIGPGKLSHAERATLFEQFNGDPRMAQIKYKADPSYDALRQPTFQHWRDDKDVADA